MCDHSRLAFIELLADSDIPAIDDIRLQISPKYQRSRRLSHFGDCLDLLISFVHQGNGDDWKRALICGICNCDAFLAINNARLQIFMERSKSSINDLFAKMNYRTVPINHSNQSLLLRKITYLIQHNDELRQWTYRVRNDGAVESISAPEMAAISSPEPEPEPERATPAPVAVAVVEERPATPQNTLDDPPPFKIEEESSYWDDWNSGFMDDPFRSY
jgi:hypothetical protein